MAKAAAETAKQKRGWPLWARIAASLAAGLTALILAGAVLRYWITSDGGRNFILSQIDGKRVGPLGALRVSGLKGDPLAAATLADLALVDDDGVWLRARDAKITWTPLKLFAGELEIKAIDVRLVEVSRRPHVTAEPDQGGKADISLKIQDASIHEVKLADGVLGPAAVFQVSGGAANNKDGSGFARLAVTPLSGPGDKLAADANWSDKGALVGTVSASGPAGGAFASLLMAGESAAVAFDAHLAGTLADFAGDAHLSFGGRPIASLDLNRKGDKANLKADLAADQWRLASAISDFTDGPLRLEGEANLADISHAALRLSATAAAGRLEAAATADLNAFAISGPVQLSANDFEIDKIAHAVTGRLSATGQLSLAKSGGWSWQGEARVEQLGFPAGSATRAMGPITLAQENNSITWSAPKLVLEGARLTDIKDLKPAAYVAVSRGEVNLKTQTLELQQAEVTGLPGALSARGSYDIASGGFDFTGAASLARLSDFGPLTGSARGQWRLVRNREVAPMRLNLTAAGRNVGSNISALAQLLGAEPELAMTGLAESGRFVVESGSISGGGLTAQMAGHVAEKGVITARANGEVRRPIDLGGAELAALGFTANIGGTLAAPSVDLQLSNGELKALGLDMASLAGVGQVSFGKTLAGAFTLRGEADGQTLIASGRLSGKDEAVKFTDVSARLGGLNLTAPQIGWDSQGFSASFKAAGSLAHIRGIERGTINAQGQAALKDNRLQLTASGQASDVRWGDTRLQLISFEASAANDTAKLSGKVRGAVGASLDLAFGATAAHGVEGWSGQATLEGKIDELSVSTTRPLAWAYGFGKMRDGWSIDGALAALNGHLEAKLSAEGDSAASEFTIADIDLAALTRLARVNPITGRISGKSSFSNQNGVAKADLDLQVAEANPVGVTQDPVTARITGQMHDGRLELTADSQGQGFRLNAAAVVPFKPGKGFDVAPAREKPLVANLSISGRAEQLWALVGPEQQSLRGKLEADVKVAGTLASPTLQGGFSMAEGVYEHGESGLRLRDIAAKGAFDQRSAQITDFSASDGSGGKLTAQGGIDWQKNLAGGVKFTATDLHALGREDRSAIVSGDGSVSLKPDAVLVSGDLKISQARFSIEQPAAASIPTLPGVKHVNFAGVADAPDKAEPTRPVKLDLKISAPRRVVVFGRGLDTEWSTDVHVTGLVDDPNITGTATLVRGTLSLAGQRFDFDTGTVRFDGPLKNASADITATRSAADVDATVHVTGSPLKPAFTLTSTPALPQDEILARVIFGKSASQLSGLEAAQLAASLTQLAGGEAAFDPSALLRNATGLDRVSFGSTGGIASVSAGKYVADNVYLEVGAGGIGGAAADVEWQPRPGLSVTSGAQANGDTRIAVRWKKDY